MGKFTPNPAAEVSAGFEAVRPGEYRMRIKAAVDRASEGKTDYKLTLEHILTKAELTNVDGEPMKGNAGGVFVYLPYDSERQGMLKGAVLAMGLSWDQGFDETEFIGREIPVVLKLDTYNGVVSNKVARFVTPK
jgi:hypothetical protein